MLSPSGLVLMSVLLGVCVCVCVCVRAHACVHVHTHKLCSDQPSGLYKPSVSQVPGPLEGIVEVSVSFDPEMGLF